MRIAVGIASSDRPDVLYRTLEALSRQSRSADRTLLSLGSERDISNAASVRASGVEIILGDRGLTRQRNALLAAARDCDLMAFFDDDFVPCENYLEEAERLFTTLPRVVLATGAVLADGKLGPGLTFDFAYKILWEHSGAQEKLVRPTYNGYGCNMVVSLAPIRQNGLRFDERLPLYGWLEDVDFSRQIARFGEVVEADVLMGVHLGVKGGRQSGRKLGYSQIANPLYLVLKRTLRSDIAVWLMFRNIIMNLIRSFNPEPFVDRRGRLVGNAMGLRDLFMYRLTPERAQDI